MENLFANGYIQLQTIFYMKNQHLCSIRTPSINTYSLQTCSKPRQDQRKVTNRYGKQDLATSALQKENGKKMAADSASLSPIERKMGELRRWKFLCAGIGIGEAILQISLVIIQYISCGLHPFLLTVLILLPLGLAVVLVVLVNRIPFANLQSTASKQQILHKFSTQPRIDRTKVRRDAQKTKKIEIVQHAKYTGEATVKNLKKLQQKVQNKQEEPFSLKGVVLITVGHGLLSLFVGVTSLVLQRNLVIIPLSVGCLLLIVASVFCTIKLWQAINSCVPEHHSPSQERHQLQIQGNSGAELVLKVRKSSIDHTLPLKPTTSTLSIDKNMDKEILAQANQIIVDPEVLQELDRIQAKKSVLKSTKSRLPKIVRDSQIGKEEEEQGGERRRVEINSKKIQYFEYSEISPANSARGDSPVRPQQESKFSNQRIKYYKQLLIEEALLKRKQLQNQTLSNTYRQNHPKAP